MEVEMNVTERQTDRSMDDSNTITHLLQFYLRFHSHHLIQGYNNKMIIMMMMTMMMMKENGNGKQF